MFILFAALGLFAASSVIPDHSGHAVSEQFGKDLNQPVKVEVIKP